MPVEERAEEEESDCNYVGGEIAVFVELLCGAIATNMQAKEEEEEEEVVVVEEEVQQREQRRVCEGSDEAWMRDRGGLLLFCSTTAKRLRKTCDP